MFDMGFTELMLIGVVGLVVIGPERLPGVARTAGKYFGKLKRFVSSVKADVESELRADELREILSKQQDELNSLRDAVGDVGKDVNSEVNGVVDSLNKDDSEYDHEWVASLETPQDADSTGKRPDAGEKTETPAKPAKSKAGSKSTPPDQA